MSGLTRDRDSMNDVLSSIRDVMSGKLTKDTVPKKIQNTNEKSTLVLTTSIQEDGTIKDLKNKEADVIKNAGTPATPSEVPTWASLPAEPTFIQPQTKAAEDIMISPQVIAESVAALCALTTQIPQNDAATSEARKLEPAGSRTIEELAHEILKPMLKDWLDSHLPSLVKWIVTEQIEKIMQQQQKIG